MTRRTSCLRSKALLRNDFDVITAATADEAESILQSQPIHLLLTDQRMLRRTGIQLLEWTREHSPRTVRLLMTGYSELDEAVDAINRGQIYYYLLKPWRTQDLLQILRNAAEKYLLERKREELLGESRISTATSNAASPIGPASWRRPTG